MNFASSKFILALAFTLGAMAFGDRATAQERLRVAWAGGASNATIWIVQEKGLLKKQGVNAEFISVNASPMALRWGIDPNTDVKLVPVGATADALAALSKGIVQFSILVEPFVREAEKLGFKSLIDISALNIPFHWNAALTREATIRLKAPVMTKFVRALAEAIHIFKTDKDSTMKIISKFTRITNPDSPLTTALFCAIVRPRRFHTVCHRASLVSFSAAGSRLPGGL